MRDDDDNVQKNSEKENFKWRREKISKSSTTTSTTIALYSHLTCFSSVVEIFFSLFLSFWLSLSHSHSLFVISPSYIQSREKDCTVCGSELAIYSTQIARAHLWAFYASVFIVYCDCFKNWKETKLRTKWMKN